MWELSVPLKKISMPFYAISVIGEEFQAIPKVNMIDLLKFKFLKVLKNLKIQKDFYDLIRSLYQHCHF